MGVVLRIRKAPSRERISARIRAYKRRADYPLAQETLAASERHTGLPADRSATGAAHASHRGHRPRAMGLLDYLGLSRDRPYGMGLKTLQCETYHASPHPHPPPPHAGHIALVLEALVLQHRTRLASWQIVVGSAASSVGWRCHCLVTLARHSI